MQCGLGALAYVLKAQLQRRVVFDRRLMPGSIGWLPQLKQPRGALPLVAMMADVRSKGQEKFHRLNKPLALDIQKFFEQTAVRQIRQATQAAVRDLKNSDHYLRRV